MIKLAFFDFSRTVAKGSGFGAGPSFLNRKEDFDKLFEEFKSHKINEEEYIESGVRLWEGFKVEDLPIIFSQIEINPNVQDVLKQLKDIQIKLSLISNIPLKLAELSRDFGFDYIFGNDCEVKEGVFTGKVLKMKPDKGIIVESLCNKLGISPMDCIAVGDSRADIGMFKAVGYENSFAYNANEEAQKHAKYHIKDFKEMLQIIK